GGVVQLPSLSQHAANRGMQRLRQSLHDVARLVNLTALDRRGTAEGSADRLGQGLGAVNDEQSRHCRVEPALDQIIDQRLDGRGVFGRSLGKAERMLVALRVNTDRCNQDQIFVHVNAIDLDHQQIEAGEIGCHPILHARRRQRYEAAGGGRFRQTSPRRPRNVSLRQPNRSGKLTRRDIDQHLVQGPFPEPVLRNCRLPTRYTLLLPVKAAKPWPLDFDLAAVEADLALRFPPAVRPPVTTSRMPWTTDCLCIAIHHLAKGLHAGSQAKQLETRRNLRQGLKLQRSRRNRSRCSKLVHGVAFLCGITTPSLAAQGEQRRFSYFNIERDNSSNCMTILLFEPEITAKIARLDSVSI